MRYTYDECMNNRWLARWYDSAYLRKDWTRGALEALRAMRPLPLP
ncbi:hypothetical protein ACFQWF_02330 [Methylorubrum suomiense]|uniref:Uncharacterized protein n=1 Tax=Methylorubrum suomiense TaxID=144191 RepID=A0ABQ4V3E7_9HYPH|nr:MULTISPECIES: hypothetical protein [Methylobacteriaceae]GJE78520.1 hypothetical protein BGCPKDLD_5137 [Methylorubrum suomiense]